LTGMEAGEVRVPTTWKQLLGSNGPWGQGGLIPSSRECICRWLKPSSGPPTFSPWYFIVIYVLPRQPSHICLFVTGLFTFGEGLPWFCPCVSLIKIFCSVLCIPPLPPCYTNLC
jgi:hypothetical protein